jgi:hypothetical protein
VDSLVDGTVKNGPRWWLRFDGVVLLVGSLVLFGTTGEPWWLVPLVILVPDLFMAGYAGEPAWAHSSTTWATPTQSRHSSQGLVFWPRTISSSRWGSCGSPTSAWIAPLGMA